MKNKQLKTNTQLFINTTITDAGIMDPAQFTRKNLKSALHIITQELKKRGTKTPHIFLPFRSKVNDEKLESFLSSIAPLGELRTDNTLLQQLCSETDEFTLISALKYFWSRLPNNEIIGWDVYLEFKRREAEKGYPKMHSYRLCQNVCHLQLMPLLSMIFGFDIEHNIKFSIQLSKWSENKQDGKFLGI